MSVFTDPQQWAQAQLGHVELGDKRRTTGFLKISTDMAHHAGKSLVKTSQQNGGIKVKDMMNFMVTDDANLA